MIIIERPYSVKIWGIRTRRTFCDEMAKQFKFADWKTYHNLGEVIAAHGPDSDQWPSKLHAYISRGIGYPVALSSRDGLTSIRTAKNMEDAEFEFWAEMLRMENRGVDIIETPEEYQDFLESENCPENQIEGLKIIATLLGWEK